MRTTEHFTETRDENFTALAYRTLNFQGHRLKNVSVVYFFAILLNFTRSSLGGGGSRVSERGLGGNRAKERDLKSELALGWTYQIFEWDRKTLGPKI